MRHVITLLVENEFGVLARIAGLFSGRGFNIECLSVAETLDPAVSTMTIVTRGDDQIIEQVLKQLNKLIPVIKVVDLIDKDFVEREMILDRAVALGRENLPLGKIKLIALLVLWNQHEELDPLIVENLLTPVDSGRLH